MITSTYGQARISVNINIESRESHKDVQGFADRGFSTRKLHWGPYVGPRACWLYIIK